MTEQELRRAFAHIFDGCKRRPIPMTEKEWRTLARTLIERELSSKAQWLLVAGLVGVIWTLAAVAFGLQMVML